MTTVSLLGSTGSIGTQTVEVVREDPDRYQIVAIGAARSVDLLAEQARELRPKQVAIADEQLASALQELVPPGTEVLAGPQSLADIATTADVCVNGVTGFAGLPVTLAALTSGKRLALANKESLIAGGPVVQRARTTKGAEIIPVDSEHCAVHMCLRSAGDRKNVNRIVLTAARRDRPSFGCQADRTYTFFDECLIGALPRASTWRAAFADTVACVGRMERRGLVKRTPCGDDRRGALIHLTAKGRKTLERAAPPHVESVRQHFIDVMTPDELETLANITTRVIGRLTESTEKTSSRMT